VSQNLDVSIFHAIRDRTGHSHKWLRNTVSTGTSQLLDTALFTVLAFVVLPPLFGQGTVPLAVVASIIVAEYLIKLAVAVLDTSVFYVATAAAEHYNLRASSGND
jgi:hypothetical protein